MKPSVALDKNYDELNEVQYVLKIVLKIYNYLIEFLVISMPISKLKQQTIKMIRSPRTINTPGLQVAIASKFR